MTSRAPRSVPLTPSTDSRFCRSSFYEAFDPAEAKRLTDKLEIHYTPKHGSWLNIAEIDPVLNMSERDQVALLITDVAEEMELAHGIQAARQFVKVATSDSPIIGLMVDPWLTEKN